MEKINIDMWHGDKPEQVTGLSIYFNDLAGFIPAFCRAVNGYFARFDSGGRSFWHPVAICCTVNFWRVYAFRSCQR